MANPFYGQNKADNELDKVKFNNASRIDIDESNTDPLEAGTGITGGTDTVYKSWQHSQNGIISTYIYLDMDGLLGAGGAKDVIGKVGTANCHLGRIGEVAVCGTLFAGRMTCLETPAGGETDIDLYSSNVATGTENVAYDHSDMGTEVALLTAGAAWSSDLSANQYNVAGFTGLPNANDYLYMVKGGANSTSEYTGGKFLIELFGTK